jgi:HK97 family phage prohead protease
MKLQRAIQPRILPLEVRAIGERQAEVICCTYNVVDDYGTIWLPGCWTESLNRKKPKSVWGHDWLDPIGQVVDFKDSAKNLRVTIQFSDFDAVPRARQAHRQMMDGDIDELSFGFELNEWSFVEGGKDGIPEGAREKVTRATMYEVSPVLVGAVPGTKVLSVRSANVEGTIEIKAAGDVLTLLAAGEIDLHEALGRIKGAAGTPPPTPAEPEEPATEEPPAEIILPESEITEALAILDRY